MNLISIVRNLCHHHHPSFIPPALSSSIFYSRRLNSSLETSNVQSAASDTMVSNGTTSLRLKNPAIFVCDIQTKFARAIYQFDKVVLTSQKLLKFANAFNIPVHTTTQISAKLGDTVSELAVLLKDPPHDKTLFSMCIPSVMKKLSEQSSVALVGIESHICITQTALDLRDEGHHVFVIADGVSSANKAEVSVALERLRSEVGVTVTTSEGWMYQCVGDARHPKFRKMLDIIKTSQKDTRATLAVLPPVSSI